MLDREEPNTMMLDRPHTDTNANEPDLPRHDLTTIALLRELRLVHRYSRRINAGAQSGDDASHDEMRQVESGGLQRSTDDNESHSHPDHAPAAKVVADKDIEDASEERAEAVATDCDADRAGLGMIECVEEVPVPRC